MSSEVEVIRINLEENFNRENYPPTVMALGYFDGVHLGHQRVIGEAKKIAEENGWSSGVMTFDPHPTVVLGKNNQKVDYLTSFESKAEEIEKLGIDFLFVIHFTRDFANLSPQEFVDNYLINLHVKHVVAGFDYSYGKKAMGTSQTLSEHARGCFETTIIEKETYLGEKVSSTLIRSFIKNGDLEMVPSLLGRFYTVEGIVVDGDKRGRTIGFPTANVKQSNVLLLPPKGVYAVKIKVQDKWYQGVCNVGTKPTFHPEKTALSIEVHIIDFHQEIYGERVVVEWHKRIRSEKKFNGIKELVQQIEQDKQTAINYFQ